MVIRAYGDVMIVSWGGKIILKYNVKLIEYLPNCNHDWCWCYYEGFHCGHYIAVFLHSQVRFVSPDDIWMSLDYHRQSCHITIIIYNPSAEAKKGYFTSLYEVLRDMGSRPRPHFGKYFNISVKDLTDAYPKYLDFRHVRSKLDPNDVFLNEVLADIF